jgi:hypothetical protein
MSARASHLWRILAIAALVCIALPGEVGVWIDEQGRTVLTDRSDGPSPDFVQVEPEELELRWAGHVLESGADLPSDTSGEEAAGDLRELRAARADVARGELRSALQSLRRLARASTVRVEAAWLLARVELHRGRLEPARDALNFILSRTTDPAADALRAEALGLRAEIESELEHAQQLPGENPSPRTQRSAHYALHYDHRLAGREFGERLLDILEQTRVELAGSLGHELANPLDVQLYTRAQYLEAYQHRFGFATVGFYDGAIHVVSTREPRLRLKALLMHEHVHALFMDALGTHQPFFLNEGIAEREEERVLGRSQMAAEDWRELIDALREERWLPLRSLVGGFAHLDGARARLAYLESRAAVELIARKPDALARWLSRCVAREPWESSLAAETGWNVDRLEQALITEIRGRFPEMPEEGMTVRSGS